MAQTPNIIGSVVMERLRELNLPATPEHYERIYYEVSGLPRPDAGLLHAQNSALCIELMTALRNLVQDITEKADHLARDLGDQNDALNTSANALRQSRERDEILRLLSTVVNQAGGIHSTVQASKEELVEARQTLQTMQQDLVETRQMLNEDALTGALNRRGLDQTLTREISRAQRNKTKMAVAMVDIDHFKKVNDRFGHDAGDRLLVHFADLMRAVMRRSDALVRYGGEEFTLVLPETDALGARFVLSRLQELNERTPLCYEGDLIATTFSAGIATLHDDENGHALLRRADEALYKAKSSGRNCIKMA